MEYKDVPPQLIAALEARLGADNRNLNEKQRGQYIQACSRVNVNIWKRWAKLRPEEQARIGGFVAFAETIITKGKGKFVLESGRRRPACIFPACNKKATRGVRPETILRTISIVNPDTSKWIFDAEMLVACFCTMKSHCPPALFSFLSSSKKPCTVVDNATGTRCPTLARKSLDGQFWCTVHAPKGAKRSGIKITCIGVEGQTCETEGRFFVTQSVEPPEKCYADTTFL